MKKIIAGLIAAGTGTRFREAGFEEPKPMIRVAGTPLIDWTVSQFRKAGLRELVTIFNTGNCRSCSEYIKSHFPELKMDIECLDTGSSFESFLNVLSRGCDTAMLITTIDSIYIPGTLTDLLAYAENISEEEMILGITRFIDDEKPLYAALDQEGYITALGEKQTPYVTTGVYLMPPGAFSMGKGRTFPALRKFLGFLLANGVKCHGFDMGKSLDVDRPEDIMEAEKFITTFDRNSSLMRQSVRLSDSQHIPDTK